MSVRVVAIAAIALCTVAASASAEQRWIRQTPTSTSGARASLVESDEIVQIAFPNATSAIVIVKGNVSFTTSDAEDIAWLRSQVQKNQGSWVRVALVTPTGTMNTSERYVKWADVRSVRRITAAGSPALELWAEGQNYQQPSPLRVTDKAEVERIVKLTRVP